MSILITGGAGFIGSHLVEKLFLQKYNVVVLDDLSTGNLKNLDNIFEEITFIEANLCEYDLYSLDNIDSVIHLSAQTSVPISIKDFKCSSQTNLLSNINVIEYCSNSNIPLVYASSSSIYGNTELGDDMSEIIDLISPYAIDKYSMELYANVANKNYNLSSIGLRFFNVYGPRQDPSSEYSGVISIFIDRLKKDKEIQINGGYQTRDFVFVDDVVNIIEKSIQLTKKQIVCEKVNVLTGKSCTINELLFILSKILNKSAQTVLRDLPYGDPEISDGTTDKMSQLFNIDIKNMISLKSGLKKTINFGVH